MIYYIYKITFLKGSLSNHYYIGKHCAKDWAAYDKYTGSGINCKNYFKKYGKILGETYTKDMLNVADCMDDLSEMEKLYIGTLFKSDPLCENLKVGGIGGSKKGRKLSEKAKLHISQAQKNKKLSDIHKQHISENHKGFEGHCHSLETRKKQSDAHKGHVSWNKDLSKEQQPMYGKHHSEESRKRMSESKKGRHWKLVDGKRVYF